ncbi:connectin [Cataglyphis hispanica]|uniref:connectin n=1 Tax=Cataglyphis hispanica TaxID=1086592 RepID=UPI00217FBD3D|nr:connectin [Cataglyphis hispanica]XP_050449412.1 connectin [Cataglyphis hispanica]XP_050449422.1 connectin [Cataglyphis hispanica]XP_050449431.1 connectin [Cataglyphis hispanica]
MRQFLYTFLILQLLTILFASSSLAVTRQLRGKKKIVAKEAKETNICDVHVQQAPIYCYCNNNGLQNATNANCWVMSKVERDNPMWSSFTSQIHLKDLTFTVRQIDSLDYVPSQLLHQLKSLRSVTFQYANFHEIVEHTFSNLIDIIKINLNRNMIFTLHKNAFENMRDLTVINLDENHISEINRDTFVNLPSLRKLHLNQNNISTVRDRAFKHLSLLQELELSSNQITSITHETFYGLRNLLRLDLRNNQIAMIGKRNFAELSALIELELDQNAITYISEKAYDGMHSLQKLRLSENLLVKLPQDFLAGAPGVYFLDLRRNYLKTMTFDNIKPIVTNLYDPNSHFYLSENDLICDCKLAWIWGLRNETKNMKLRDALEELTCFLESSNTTQKINNEGLGKNQPEIAKEYSPGISKDDSNEYNEDDSSYNDEIDDENSSSNSNFDKISDRKCCRKHLFELKPEELPCPEISREDLMASEQPSSRHENARVGSSGSSWFSSGSISIQAGQSILATLSLLLLSILFST